MSTIRAITDRCCGRVLTLQSNGNTIWYKCDHCKAEFDYAPEPEPGPKTSRMPVDRHGEVPETVVMGETDGYRTMCSCGCGQMLTDTEIRGHLLELE